VQATQMILLYIGWFKMNLKEFGEFFAEIRKREGYNSQRELAEKSGVNHATISRLESGTTRTSPEILEQLSKCFKYITYEELLRRAGYLNEDDLTHKIEQIKKKSDSVISKIMEAYRKSQVKNNSLQQDIINIYDSNIVEIPIYGTIKAGYDLIAEQNIIGYEVVSKKLVSDGEYFYLIVKGDSMIGDGITDGCKVLIRRQNYVENGKIGVVLIDGEEATLKRIYYEGNNVILQASNPKVEPRILSLNDVMIQGQVKSYIVDVD
jgi:repressor LexA